MILFLRPESLSLSSFSPTYLLAIVANPEVGLTSDFLDAPEAAAPQQPENFWGNFSETMARDPQNAWKVLNQVQPNTVQNKLFVME